MKQSKDPFEAAFAEEEEEDLEEDSLPESPTAAPPLPSQTQTQTQTSPPPPSPPPPYLDATSIAQEDDQIIAPSDPSSSMPMLPSSRTKPKNKDAAAAADDDYEDNDDNNMDVELTKFPSSADPDKMAKMQSILSQFTEDQMTRYESFRRSALQKSNMRRLLVSITGSQKISLPMTIVVCGIAKMFVGELVETARIVMKERKESGPIRPCHIREAYRRLKLEGKVAKRSVPRLFR